LSHVWSLLNIMKYWGVCRWLWSNIHDWLSWLTELLLCPRRWGHFGQRDVHARSLSLHTQRWKIAKLTWTWTFEIIIFYHNTNSSQSAFTITFNTRTLKYNYIMSHEIPAQCIPVCASACMLPFRTPCAFPLFLPGRCPTYSLPLSVSWIW
jgi:hypothetical protein